MQQLEKICREKGLKITPQRAAVYSAVAALETPPSADEVYRQVQKQLPNISFDTVNRTLLTFSDVGLIDIIESSSGVRRFDPQIEPHHHLQCSECGRIFDFTNSDYDNLPVPQEFENIFTVEKTRVFVTGTCSTCRKKRKRSDTAGSVRACGKIITFEGENDEQN